MLINVTHDREFQRFLDRREQRLHVDMVPLLVTGTRMAINGGGEIAQQYVVERGQAILIKHYKQISREVYGSVERQIAKQDSAGVNGFLESIMVYLERRAGRAITDISHSLIEDIRQTVFRGMQEGLSNNEITSQLRAAIPDMSRNRAATIARTETHNAAMSAMDETLDYKHIEIAIKRWWTAGDARVRPSHRAMHDVAVARNEPFDTDDGEMMFPGDDSLGADPGGIINCRCSVLYETGEPD